MNNVNLAMLVEESNAEGALILNVEGQLIDSLHIANENNIAAMAAVILTMSEEFFQDSLNSKNLNQLVFAAEDGLIVMSKFDENHIICVMTKDVTKTAIIKLILEKIKKNNKKH